MGNSFSFNRITKKNGWVSIFFNGVPSRLTKSKAQILKHKVDPLFLRFFSAYLLRIKFKVFNYSCLYLFMEVFRFQEWSYMYYVLKTRLFLIWFLHECLIFHFSSSIRQCKRRWEGWCPCVPCAVLIMPIHQVLMRSNINAGSRSAYLRTGQCRLSQELWWPFNLLSLHHLRSRIKTETKT